jgi:hypothetical protein
MLFAPGGFSSGVLDCSCLIPVLVLGAIVVAIGKEGGRVVASG